MIISSVHMYMFLSFMSMCVCMYTYRERETELISVEVSHKLLSNPAPVLWLNPVGMVYSGTVNLQPPLALPSASTPFSLCLVVYLFYVFPSLSLFPSVLCLLFDFCLWSECLLSSELCMCVRAHERLWSIRQFGVYFSRQSPRVAEGGLGCFDRQRETEKGRQRKDNEKPRKKEDYCIHLYPNTKSISGVILFLNYSDFCP